MPGVSKHLKHSERDWSKTGGRYLNTGTQHRCANCQPENGHSSSLTLLTILYGPWYIRFPVYSLFYLCLPLKWNFRWCVWFGFKNKTAPMAEHSLRGSVATAEPLWSSSCAGQGEPGWPAGSKDPDLGPDSCRGWGAAVRPGIPQPPLQQPRREIGAFQTNCTTTWMLNEFLLCFKTSWWLFTWGWWALLALSSSTHFSLEQPVQAASGLALLRALDL